MLDTVNEMGHGRKHQLSDVPTVTIARILGRCSYSYSVT